MKRFFILILAAIFLLNCSWVLLPKQTQAAVIIEHQAEAQVLYFLGVFNGTQQGFELERIPTRAEGAVMLVRLLGQEDYALQARLSHPFRDVPSWADPYVAYLYQQGLSKGTSAWTFSPHAPLSAEQYMSYLLRTLAYDESQGDFVWNESLTKAREVHILDTAAYKQFLDLGCFRRDHMVWLSYLGLQSKLKNQPYTLLEKLVEKDHVITETAVAASGIYSGNTSSFSPQLLRAPGVYSARNALQLQLVLENALLNMETGFAVYVNDYPGSALNEFENALAAAQNSISTQTGIAQICKKWHCLYDGEELEVTIEYVYNDKQYLTLMKKVREIINGSIHKGMNDYEKEKALHDYIINHAEYDYDNFLHGTIPASSYTAYGVLVLGRGVCQGYAEAMHLLCHATGLKSMVVQGSSIFEGKWYNHAWNIVQLGGAYYHLDVCWDDVIAPSGKGALGYSYFNLNDQDIAKDHRWNKQQYPTCTATQYNYYAYNRQQVQNYQGFRTFVNNALAGRAVEITVKVADFKHSDYGDLGSLMFRSGKVQRYNYSIDEDRGIIFIFSIVYN